MARIFALSDIHVDYPDNRAWIENLSEQDYRGDTLILAGDVTHDLGRLEQCFAVLKRKFAKLFFVPGNHELWLIKTPCGDSVAKFYQVLDLCAAMGVATEPAKVGHGQEAVWVVPLFSWYVLPEEGGESLFMPKPGEDPSLEIWSDHHFVKWPAFPDGTTAADFFARLNQAALARDYDAPVISYSHFLPRTELLFSSQAEDRAAGNVVRDTNKRFNFSRVAGSRILDRQLRRLKSKLHVYGHQHRNRDRKIDGVRYVSHCLGYGHERKLGQIRFLGNGPKLVWRAAAGVSPSAH